MDLGMFRWGKRGFLSWVIGPPALLAVIFLPMALYSHHLRKDCSRRQAILMQIPEMSRQIAASRELIRRFIVQPAGGAVSDNAAEASQRIYLAAQKHKFAIRSLNADKAESDGKSGLAELNVLVQGDGTLPDIIAMFDDLNVPEQLCATEMVRLNVSRSGAEQLTYGAEMSFKCHVVSSALGEAVRGINANTGKQQ